MAVNGEKIDTITFNLEPFFRIGRTGRTSAGGSEVSDAGGMLNDSRTSGSMHSDTRQGGIGLDLGLKNLGREKRALIFYTYRDNRNSSADCNGSSNLPSNWQMLYP